MFEFKNILPSKVLEYGTDMSCLDDKFYVCRVKKNFGINNSENTIVLEAGDIIGMIPRHEDVQWSMLFFDVISMTALLVLTAIPLYLLESPSLT